VKRSEFFWNIIAKKYSKQSIADEAAYQYKLKKTQEHFNEDSRVLEFGCGTGSTALIHAPLVKEVVAMDYSQNMIDIANAKAKKASVENVQFIKSTLMEFVSLDENQSEKFDVVLALNILHLLKDYKDHLKVSFDLLNPGGIFVASTACMGDGGFMMNTILPFFSALRILPCIKVLTTKEFEKSLKDAGFDILEHSTPGKDKNAWFTIAKKPN
jgi:ubiquinone/menaquinone biosynthesis C-methylase UbiE